MPLWPIKVKKLIVMLMIMIMMTIMLMTMDLLIMLNTYLLIIITCLYMCIIKKSSYRNKYKNKELWLFLTNSFMPLFLITYIYKCLVKLYLTDRKSLRFPDLQEEGQAATEHRKVIWMQQPFLHLDNEYKHIFANNLRPCK